MIAGTIAYMAPERIRGKDAGPAGDVYSLGAVAYETLSGRRARQATTPVAALNEALERPPDLREAWSAAPAATAAAIERGMDPDPERRPASAGELADRIAVSLGGEDAGPGTPAPLAATGS